MLLKSKKEIERYLSGKKRKIRIKSDPDTNNRYYKKVWKAASGILYGETKSYKWVAEKTGNGNKARVVGKALGDNPLPLIIPCHRVIKNNGKLGGFSAGSKWKKRLLEELS